MSDKLPFFAAESGTWKTTAPNPHIDLSGTALALGTYPTQTFKDAADDTTLNFASGDTCTVTVWADATHWARYEGAVWTDAATDTLDLSAATLMGAMGTLTADSAVSVVASLPVEIETIQIAVTNQVSPLVAGTNQAKFRMPWAMIITAVRAAVTTAPTGSTIIVDINESGTSILSTKLSIDTTELTSTTAATAAVLSDAALADDAEISIDIDQVGSTVAGIGLTVTIIGRRA